MPHNADQPYWGKVVKQLGVGTDPIPRKKLSVENLSRTIQTATSNKVMCEKAQLLSQKIGQGDSLGEAMKWVQRYLSQF